MANDQVTSRTEHRVRLGGRPESKKVPEKPGDLNLKIYKFDVDENGKKTRRLTTMGSEKKVATKKEVIKEAEEPVKKTSKKRPPPYVPGRRTLHSTGFRLIRQSIVQGDASVESIMRGKPLSSFTRAVDVIALIDDKAKQREQEMTPRASSDDGDDNKEENIGEDADEDVEQTLALFALFNMEVSGADTVPSSQRVPGDNESVASKRPGSAGTVRSSGSTESAMSGGSSVSFVSAASGLTAASKTKQKKKDRQKKEQLQSLTRKNTQDYLDVNHGFEDFVDKLETKLSAKEEEWRARDDAAAKGSTAEGDDAGPTSKEEPSKSRPVTAAKSTAASTVGSLKLMPGGGTQKTMTTLLDKAETANVASRKTVAGLARTIDALRSGAADRDKQLKATLHDYTRQRHRQLRVKFDSLLPGGQSIDEDGYVPSSSPKTTSPPKGSPSPGGCNLLILQNAAEDDDSIGQISATSQDLTPANPPRRVFRDIRVELLAMKRRVQVKERSRLQETIQIHTWLRPILKKVAADAKKYGKFHPPVLRFLGAINRSIMEGDVVKAPLFFSALRYAFTGDDWKLKIVEKMVPLCCDALGISHEDFVDWLRQHNIVVSPAFLRGSNRRGKSSRKGGRMPRTSSRARASALGSLEED